MTLTHHDSRPIAVATTEAHATTRERFRKRIDAGRAEGQKVLESILATTPQDTVADTRAFSFAADDDGLLMRILDRHEEMRVHDNALSQFCERTDVPPGYLKGLLNAGDWGRALAVKTLDEVAKHRPRRVLARRVGGQVRGILSDSFRRLDSRPLVEAFAKACAEIGALPLGGHATDLRVGLMAAWPEVVEVNGEPLLFGLRWQNSDFGVGGHEIKAFVERLWCTNLATRENVLRQVHLGKRLSDDLAFSQRTYDLDTRATASAVADIVRGHLSEAAVKKEAARIEEAARTEVDEKKAKRLLEEKLNKTEAKEALAAFATNPRVEDLPQGTTIWRLSNAVSWLAKGAEAERKIELQEVAGWLLNSAKAA